MRLLWRIIRKILRSLFLAVVTVVGAPAAAALTVFAGLLFLPLPATIPVPKPNPVVEPTVIYDRFGQPIATLARFDQNLPVAESQIPPILKEAVIADEDRNFYHEGGVNVRGTLRALYEDVRHNGPLQGGSTITQQYVKLAYTNGHRTLLRKIREAVLASQLDRQASKNEILYRYLTVVYFGDGNYGIGAASESYFHVPVNLLDASQAATLAGLIPAPSARAPRQNLAGAEIARELVLGKMRQQGYLTEAQYRAAMVQKLALATTGAPPAGATVVYPPPTATSKYPDFVDYVLRWLEQRYTPAQIYGGGLRVQTTLDPRVQDAAYAAVQNTLSGTSEPLQMALAAVEPSTGFVEALVGGREFGKGPFADDNLAIGGCDPPIKGASVQVTATCWNGKSIYGGTPGRQPGSAWKPFVLATAFEQGIPPTKTYNAPSIYQVPGCKPGPTTPASACQIGNAEPSIPGTVTLDTATVDSINTVYAQVAPEVGCPNVAATAKSLGVQSAFYSTPPFYQCERYALGELDVSPLSMASAYGVFADHGLKAAPTPVLEIVNASGKVLLNNIAHRPATTRALSANVADNVTKVLQGVITSGTGTAAGIGRPAAGKTGTTNNYTNAWFVGYTPTLSTAVWMGNAASQSTSLGDVKGVDPVYGGTWPALTWRAFMSEALKGVPVTPFTAPAPITAQKSAISSSTSSTRPTVSAGSQRYPQGTPTGGPYQYPATPPLAPPAPTQPPPTLPPPTAPPSSPPPSSTPPSSTLSSVLPLAGLGPSP